MSPSLPRRIAQRIDAVRYSPVSVGDALLAHANRNNTCPTGPVTVEQMFDYVDRIDDGPLSRAGRALRRLSADRAVLAIRHAYQRATRGYTDSDMYNIGDHLCSHLGRMLTDWANMPPTGHPTSYPDYDTFVADIAHHGAVLASRGRSEHPDLTAAWFEADRLARRSGDPADRAAADEALRSSTAADEAADEAVRGSLAWVAEHHADLWD